MSRFDARPVSRMERMYGSPPIVEQRARTRAALATKPGERGAGMVETMAAIVTKFGIERAEAQARVDDMKGRTGEGDYFFSLNRCLFLAHKP